MAGTAERYWKELRPSSAAQFRLNAGIRHDPEPADRHLRRPRHKVRPELRSSSR